MTQPEPSLESLLKQESELSSLPEIYITISDLIDNQNSTSSQIGQVVESDPALSLRILKMVNSAFYGFPQEIDSISQAITILGRDRLRQILIGSVLSGVFGRVSSKVIDMHEFWEHSVKAAILARNFCLQMNTILQADTMFTAGLLHDIGRLILAQLLPQQSMEIQKIMESSDENIIDIEQRILGFTHCDVGEGFIRKWGLPEILASAAHCHHNADKTTETNTDLGIIYLANRLTFLEFPLIDQHEVELALDEMPTWQDFGLSLQQITDVCLIANEQVSEVMESLGMNQLQISG